MSYFNTTQVTLADGGNIDAFARLRTSNAVTLFDSKQLYDTGSLFWTTGITGNATASFVSTQASVLMAANGNPSKVIRQTKRQMNYQPGKSSLIVMTSNLSGSDANSIKRVGYFNDNNGLYFGTTGSAFGVGLIKNGVHTFVSQSAWNVDVFNGTGASGKTIDITKSQIYFIDFEWLGVGRVRYGIFQGGLPYYVHQITNINALSDVYMSNPNLPIRYELINSGSNPQSMLHICSCVMSEGGEEETGQIRSVDYGGLSNTTTVGTADQFQGIVALRLKAGLPDGNAAIRKFSALNTAGANAWQYALFLNPSTGSNWSFQDVQDSVCQYATASAAAGVALTGGYKIVSGYVSSTTDGTDEIPPKLSIPLGYDINGVSDVYVLAVNTTTTNQKFVGSLTFQENV